jgi:hypothetical protein
MPRTYHAGIHLQGHTMQGQSVPGCTMQGQSVLGCTKQGHTMLRLNMPGYTTVLRMGHTSHGNMYCTMLWRTGVCRVCIATVEGDMASMRPCEMWR